jgi:5-(aminomethyl)-3-furanmethanol phosphate kinase
VKPTVIKLGGSLAESARLGSILDIVARARSPIVIVPGGGAFADAVRRAQGDFKFSDAAAHRMALLAMHQTGLMLSALHPRLKPAETLAGLRRVVAGGAIPVWLPFKLAHGDRRLTADWSTTSDGLAARLAERLGRAPVVLIKSCRIAKGSSIAVLAREGIIDAAFKAIVERARLPWRVLGADDEDELKVLIAAGHRGSRRRSGGEACRRAGGERAIARRS